MSDENKKTDTDDNVDIEAKSETVKKPAAVRKKVKAKSSDGSTKDGSKKKIIEKLKAMGVMSRGKAEAKADDNNSEKGRFPTALVASVVVVIAVGSFVWALNNKATNDQVASGSNDSQSVNNVMHSAYPGVGQPSSYNRNNNSGYPGYNYQQQQQRLQQQRAQQQKWMQQQHQAREQQRAQQQKWAQQQQQQYAQRRAEQEKWMQQQQQAEQQQYAQQQPAQKPYWGQQQQQQPYYAYPPYAGNNGQAAPGSYNYAPAYQQPNPYYGRQY